MTPPPSPPRPSSRCHTCAPPSAATLCAAVSAARGHETCLAFLPRPQAVYWSPPLPRLRSLLLSHRRGERAEQRRRELALQKSSLTAAELEHGMQSLARPGQQATHNLVGRRASTCFVPRSAGALRLAGRDACEYCSRYAGAGDRGSSLLRRRGRPTLDARWLMFLRCGARALARFRRLAALMRLALGARKAVTPGDESRACA